MRNLKRALSLALASVMLLGMMVVGSSAASYPDVDASNNLEAIEVLKMLKLMEGDEKGSFNPKENVSRYQMTALVCKLLGLNPGGNVPFTDIASKDSWATPYVAACYNQGIVAGTSKTTFDGTRSVTAVEAGLMLMRTLNYFYNQSELGDNWKLSTIREANHIDLYRGINVYTDQILTRDDIAQMVLNALESDVVVANQGLDINVETGDSNVNITGQWTYTPAQNNFSEDYQYRRTGDGAKYMQLCEKLYGDDLKKLADGTGRDAFERPSNQWRYKGQKVTTPIDSDVSYTAAVKGKQIYADLGNVDPTYYYAYLDGVQVAAGGNIVKGGFDVASGNEAKVGGNGILTEVYLKYDSNTVSHVDIVMTRTYAGEVNSTDKNDDGTYEITLVEEGNKTFDYPTDLEPGSVVLYTKTCNDPDGYADTTVVSTDEIKSMSIPKMISGEVTRVKDQDNFDLDGETYKYNQNYNIGLTTNGHAKVDATDVSYTMDAYLDAYGYVIGLVNVNASNNYAVALRKYAGNFGDDYQVKMLFPDGTTKIVDVKQSSYSAIAAVGVGATPGTPTIVTWTKNSDNVYTLNVPTNTTLTGSADDGSLKGERGKAALKIGGTGYTATSKTEFFFYNSNTSVDERYAWTGIKNYPGFDNGSNAYTAYVCLDGQIVKAVYVIAGNDVTGADDSSSFFYVSGTEKMWNDNKMNQYYELDAVVDGDITKVKVDTNVYFTTLGGASAIAAKIRTNDDGIITNIDVKNAINSLTNGDGYYAWISHATDSVLITRPTNEVIRFAAQNGDSAGNIDLAISDSVKVFEYDTVKDAFNTRSVNSLNGHYAKVYIEVKDSLLTSVYYIK